MSFIITESMKGRVVEITVSGKLTKEACDQFVPLTEQAIRKYGRIRVLFAMLGFQGWNASTSWEDIQSELNHFRDIERLAIVGESRWQKGMALFCRPFTTAEVKYFAHAEFDQARDWLEDGALNEIGVPPDVPELELAANS